MATGTAVLVEHYDLAVFSLALPQIQRSFHMSEWDVSVVTGVVNCGPFIACILVAALADTAGRRLALVVTVIGVGVSTTLATLAQSTAQFTIAQGSMPL